LYPQKSYFYRSAHLPKNFPLLYIFLIFLFLYKIGKKSGQVGRNPLKPPKIGHFLWPKTVKKSGHCPKIFGQNAFFDQKFTKIFHFAQKKVGNGQVFRKYLATICVHKNPFLTRNCEHSVNKLCLFCVQIPHFRPKFSKKYP